LLPLHPADDVPSELPNLDLAYAVAPDAASDFAAKGHALLRGLASAEEVAAYRPHLEAAAARGTFERRPIAERDTYSAAFLQSFNLWRADAAARRFVFARRFARAAAELLGSDGVRIYHDQALFKEPGGGHTPWHQDQFYWPLATEQTVTMWMPLADIDPRVGSMTFASGSHTDGKLRGHAISDESEAEFARLVETEGLPEHTYGALRAGDATFHAGWTLHRAGPNPIDVMRPVMTVIYFADGTRISEPDSVYQRFDLATWLPDMAPGDLAAGPLNPLLWSRHDASRRDQPS
jgi:ectoine hydroxylase-related dioxygenase (phytanoyl-CoA dioxygenase family)